MGLVLQVLQKGGSIHPLIIPEGKDGGLCNPSIYYDWHTDRLLCNLRHVKYTLYQSRRHPHVWGPLVYIHGENDIKLRTGVRKDKMLYSHNGAYPKELPFRIQLPDGTSRTDPTTFTPEELASAGYVAVSDPPTVTSLQRLVWNGSNWLVTNITLEKVLKAKLAMLKRFRESAEVNFTFNGIPMKLDEKMQGRVNDALRGFDFVPDGTTTPWEVARGVFVEMDKTTLTALGLAAWNHIRDCYINTKTLTQALQACTTTQELDNIDLSTGWP